MYTWRAIETQSLITGFLFGFVTRTALFESLLYEAVGRTVNPVNGAVGLLWTGNWQVCESAVEKVFRGGSLDPLPESLAGSDRHHKACSEFCYTAGTTEQQQQRRRSSAVTAAAATATATPRVAAKKGALDHEVVIVGDQLQPVIAVPADDDQLDLCLMMSKPRAATPSEEESGTTTLGSSSGGSTPADCTTSLDNVDGGRRRKLLRLFI